MYTKNIINVGQTTKLKKCFVNNNLNDQEKYYLLISILQNG